MIIQDAVQTLPEDIGLPPRQPAQLEKTQRAVKGVGLSKPKKVDSEKPPGTTKSAGLSKPGKCAAKVGNSKGAEAAKKKSVRIGTAIIEPSQ
jgi:hypothetical protein